MDAPELPALIVLAAGESRRLGTCKALAALGEEPGATPLALLLAAGAPVAGGPPLVVTGADDEAIRRAVLEGGEEAEIAWNAAWREGRAGSLALAAALRPGRDLLLAPVDVPLVAADTFRALVEAWSAAGRPAAGWLEPRHGGRSGHPVVLGRDLAARLRGWPPERSLRLLRERAAPRLALAVEDPAVLDDLDRPEDLAALRRRPKGRAGARCHGARRPPPQAASRPVPSGRDPRRRRAFHRRAPPGARRSAAQRPRSVPSPLPVRPAPAPVGIAPRHGPSCWLSAGGGSFPRLRAGSGGSRGEPGRLRGAGDGRKLPASAPAARGGPSIREPGSPRPGRAGRGAPACPGGAVARPVADRTRPTPMSSRDA